jgi:hypothetical protein
LIFKLLELSLFYVFVQTNSLTSPIVALLGLLGIRAFTFTVIAANAYLVWKIKPDFRIKLKYLLAYLGLSLLFYLIQKLLF